MSTGLADEEVYCRDCGAVIDERAEICPECGIRQQEPESSTSEKNPGLAAAGSFIIPGVGQVYNGQIGKGIVGGVAFFAFALTGVGLIIAIPIWLYLVYDAHKVAKAGGAEAVSSGGSSPASPRTDIRRALDWEVDRADDPAEAEAVRKRFGGSKTSSLSDEDKEFVLETVEEFHRETGGGTPDDVRDALGL